MVKNIIAKRYSRALVESFDKDEYKEMDDQLELLDDFLKDNPEIENFFSSPVFKKENKIEIIEKIVKKLEIDKRFLNFFVILINKDRIYYIRAILEEIVSNLHSKLDIYDFNLITAHKIEKSTTKKIREFLKNHISGTIKLKPHIDKSIKGGFVVYNDKLIFDASIRNNFRLFFNEL